MTITNSQAIRRKAIRRTSPINDDALLHTVNRHLTDLGFTMNNKRMSDHNSYTKEFVDGYNGALHVRTIMFANSTYCSVRISGIGITKDRDCQYKHGEDHKVLARLKRLVKKANSLAHARQSSLDKNKAEADTTRARLQERGITSQAFIPKHSSTVKMTVNGYSFEVGSDLMVAMTLGGWRTEVDVDVAVNMFNAMPKYKVPDDEYNDGEV